MSFLPKIEKLVQRINSDNENESATSARQAAAILEKSGMSLADFIQQVSKKNLPMNALVVFAKAVCDRKHDAPQKKEAAFSEAMQLIAAKYGVGGSTKSTSSSRSSASDSAKAEELRRREEQLRAAEAKIREEAERVRQREDLVGRAWEVTKGMAEDMNADKRAAEAARDEAQQAHAAMQEEKRKPRWHRKDPSERGFLMNAIMQPKRTAELFWESFVFGVKFGVLAFVTIAVLHALLNLTPVIELPVPVWLGILILPPMVGKSVQLMNDGWYY